VTPAGHLTVVNAGHPAPLLLREGVAVVLRPPERRPPLGLPGTSAPLGIDLRVGDRLLLYTDGLGEARHRSDRTFFPLRQYAAPALASGSLEEGLTGVQHAVRDWTGGSLSDDVALMAVEVLSVVPDPSAEAEHEPPATT
jgi:serine phosphatase RsbU (regulator of sigma subunit)